VGLVEVVLVELGDDGLGERDGLGELGTAVQAFYQKVDCVDVAVVSVVHLD
jgi:hypothetical protein